MGCSSCGKRSGIPVQKAEDRALALHGKTTVLPNGIKIEFVKQANGTLKAVKIS